MCNAFAHIAFTPAVKAAQQLDGSRAAYARNFEGGGEIRNEHLGDDETRFIAQQRSFYMATVSETGWPYVQHRGGPRGFLKVLNDQTVSFADFAGNRQLQGVFAMITLCGFGVSNYYNKLKLVLLEKEIRFDERVVYPWQRQTFQHCSPLGKIPFIETDQGGLSESQAILEYLEEPHPQRPMYPTDLFQRAKCRELIQHLELNSEWVARRLYKESFFGGSVSQEAKREAKERLAVGLEAVARLTSFSPFAFGSSFTAADCVAYVHFFMIKQTTLKIFGEDMLEPFFPGLPDYMRRMDIRPHFRRTMLDREAALAAFLALNVRYDG
jgi:glutathione S-transferase